MDIVVDKQPYQQVGVQRQHKAQRPRRVRVLTTAATPDSISSSGRAVPQAARASQTGRSAAREQPHLDRAVSLHLEGQLGKSLRGQDRFIHERSQKEKQAEPGRFTPRYEGWRVLHRYRRFLGGDHFYHSVHMPCAAEQLRIEGSEGFRFSAKGQMQRIGKIEPLLVAFQGDGYLHRGSHRNTGQAEQRAKEYQDIASTKAVGRAQYPFRFQQYRGRDVHITGCDQDACPLRLLVIVIDEKAHYDIGVERGH